MLGPVSLPPVCEMRSDCSPVQLHAIRQAGVWSLVAMSVLLFLLLVLWIWMSRRGR